MDDFFYDEYISLFDFYIELGLIDEEHCSKEQQDLLEKFGWVKANVSDEKKTEK